MNRGEFFKEMTGSLVKTVKLVYEPFLQADLEKVEAAADQVLGITWVPLLKESELDSELEMKFLGGKPIILARFGTNMQAYDGVCPVCSHIITLRTLYSRGKCLNCQKDFDFKTQTGELPLHPLPLKLTNKIYYLGIQQQRKQGGIHA